MTRKTNKQDIMMMKKKSREEEGELKNQISPLILRSSSQSVTKARCKQSQKCQLRAYTTFLFGTRLGLQQLAARSQMTVILHSITQIAGILFVCSQTDRECSGSEI